MWVSGEGGRGYRTQITHSTMKRACHVSISLYTLLDDVIRELMGKMAVVGVLKLPHTPEIEAVAFIYLPTPHW